MDMKNSSAWSALTEFTKTGQLKDFRDMAAGLSKVEMEPLDGVEAAPCKACPFHRDRIAKLKSFFPGGLEPSHCVLSNIMSSAYKGNEGSDGKVDGYVISCYGDDRENWVEPANVKTRVRLAKIRSDVFEKLFDVARVFTESTKFVAAIEEIEGTSQKED